MSIVNSVKTLAPGIGAGDYYASTLGSSLTAGAKTIAVSSLSPTCSRGKLRVKFTQGTNGTTQITSITGTDGTTTVNLYAGDAAAVAANQVEEFTLEFITDLNLTSITVNVTVAVATATGDLELVYTV